MTPFTTLTSIAAPLIRDNVDTDTIIPSREMKSTGKTGLASGLFAPWRYSDPVARTPNPDFVLNDPRYAGAQILLSSANFGCGSSREHAVWALAEYGFRCIVAESFAPIFRNNCIRNGILPIELGQPVPEQFIGQTVTIDLAGQHISVPGHVRLFHIDDESKAMLLEGLDAIDLTLKHKPAIATWQDADRKARPWVYLNPPQAKLGEGERAARNARGALLPARPKDGGGVAHLPPRTNDAVMHARSLRRSMSPPEVILWQALRQRPGGFKFRRQHPAAGYTLDFYCPAARLCVEVDGESHSRGIQPNRDAKRDEFMQQNGIATMRLTTADVVRNLEGSLNLIVQTARERLPLHRPSDGPPPHFANGEES